MTNCLIYGHMDSAICDHIMVVNTFTPLYVTLTSNRWMFVEVDDRKVVEPQGQPCVGNTCTQGCDVYTGLCVCRHGYYLKNGYICEGQLRVRF